MSSNAFTAKLSVGKVSSSSSGAAIFISISSGSAIGVDYIVAIAFWAFF